MLFSLFLIFIISIAFSNLFEKIKLPSLIGMMICGMILGPHILDLLSDSILNISSELRQIALIIILARSGLNLDIAELKKAGRPALLLSFIPATVEICAMMLIAPCFLNVSIVEAGIIGCVVAAVSPAIIVPRMLNLIDKRYGKTKLIPQMIMAGASVDDIFVIIVFTTFTSIEEGSDFTFSEIISIPISFLLGISVGILLGIILTLLFKKCKIRDTKKIIIIISTAFLLVTVEKYNFGIINISGLLAVMSLCITLRNKMTAVTIRLSEKLSKLWVPAEIILFVLVGATINIEYLLKSGIIAPLIILGALSFRILGVFICLIKTSLNKKERIFTAFSYIPKATVQAAIGGLPLSMGLACGDIVLTIAVLSILITAPVGAVLIDRTYKKLLTCDKCQK